MNSKPACVSLRKIHIAVTAFIYGAADSA